MLITFHAHSQFLLETGNVFRILTDPYDAHTGYRMDPVKADLVLVSHGHGDHAYTDKVTGDPRVIREPGVYSAGPGITVTAIESDHDDDGGKKRGKTLLFMIEAEGLRVAHLGDLGRTLNEEELSALGRVDVLLVPVGGFFTVDAKQAAYTARALGAHTVIPMHYKTRANASWPIADETEFLSLMQAENAPRMPLLRVTAGDLSEQPGVCVLEPQYLE